MDTDSGIEPYRLEFSGSAGEFFRVWIVNFLLTIVTLGLYTPFARRRTAQYFFSHTLVADSPLEFTAQQRKMVMGFLLLVAIYILFNAAAETGQDTVVSLMLLAIALLAPWLWGSAMRFRLGSTRWRGVRLKFGASWGEIYKASWPMFAIALAWIALVVALGAVGVLDGLEGDEDTPLPSIPPVLWLLAVGVLLATVLCIIRLEFNYKSLLVARAQVGSHVGRWKPAFGDFVRIWLATLGVLLACLLLVALGIALLAGGSAAAFIKSGGVAGMIVALIAVVIGGVFVLFFSTGPARAYREARIFQLVWNNVGVSHIARFRCDLRTGPYVLLRLKNMILTLFTLGFYRPFAMVSEYRMRVESVTLHVKGGLDQLVGQLVQQQGGLGDAVADAVGLDLVG